MVIVSSSSPAGEHPHRSTRTRGRRRLSVRSDGRDGFIFTEMPDCSPRLADWPGLQPVVDVQSGFVGAAVLGANMDGWAVSVSGVLEIGPPGARMGLE